jgi:hypothetical protein
MENGFSLFRSAIMDDTAVGLAEISSADGKVSERIALLRERLARSLRDAAEIEVELSRADGTIRGVPHYSVIEGRAHELGKQRQMSELAAAQATTAKCPTCGTRCDMRPIKRPVQSVDGSIELTESQGFCTGCRRSFFPAA